MSETEIQAVMEELNMTKKLWWLHDPHWHANLVKGDGQCFIRFSFVPK